MSRGIRNNTLDRILVARERDPLALGPYIGELATRQNVPASLIAEMVGSHEQTINRWMFGQSDVQSEWFKSVTMVLALLVWMRQENYPQLIGTNAMKRHDLHEIAKAFKAATRKSGA